MNTTCNKIIKGTLAIFAIKLIFVTGIFVFQSCQTDGAETEFQQENKSNFLTSLIESRERLSTISIKNPKNNSNDLHPREYQGETVSYCLMEYDASSSTTTVEEIVENIENIDDFIQAKITHQFILTSGFGKEDTGIDTGDDTTDIVYDNQPDFNPEDCIAIIQVPIQPVIDAFEPSIEEAKNYLRSKGFTNSDIQNLFVADSEGAAMEEYNLVPTVMMLIAEEQRVNSSVSLDYSVVFGYSANASEIGQCAGDALGVSAIAAVISEGINTAAGKELLKKAVRKVARRALGWVGAAIFVYEFGDCMNWW